MYKKLSCTVSFEHFLSCFHHVCLTFHKNIQYINLPKVNSFEKRSQGSVLKLETLNNLLDWVSCTLYTNTHSRYLCLFFV